MQYLTDATVSDALLRHLLDPIMDNKLELAYSKLEELLAVHKEHPETRNHYFTNMYNALQRKQFQIKTTSILQKAAANGRVLVEDEIPALVSLLQDEPEADMDLVAAESIFNAMEAFYKACNHRSHRFYFSNSF